MKRVVPAPEWDAVFDIKVLKIKIFKGITICIPCNSSYLISC